MSGHSKWSTIKHKKARLDASRGKAWSKCARAIMVAAKTGGGNPNDNLSLRYAIDKAKAANMPKDTIEKAIRKGTGEGGGESFEQVVYEGYGPGGVAFMVECLTDNRNRTAPQLRKLFEQVGGQMGSSNCVAYMFESKGTFLIAADAASEDTVMEIALEAGAADVTSDENGHEITCEPAAFGAVKQALAEKEVEALSAEVGMVARNNIEVSDSSRAKKLLAMAEAFEDHDDVQNVYSNFDIPQDILADIENG